MTKSICFINGRRWIRKMKTFEKQFNVKTKLETLDHYVRSILNKFDPDDEIEVDIQEFDGKKIVNVKILDRVLN